MKQFIISYHYYGNDIKQSVNIVDMIAELNDPLKVETIIDVVSTLKGTEILDELQSVILKERMKQLNAIVNRLLKNAEQ